MDFNASVPIYLQINDFVKRMIVSGQWERGSRVSSVRELAQEMGVNPNTIQKAIGFLEDQGLLYTERTSGRYVTMDQSVIEKVKKEMTVAETEGFMTSMRGMGYQDKEIFEWFAHYIKVNP